MGIWGTLEYLGGELSIEYDQNRLYEIHEILIKIKYVNVT